jgi:predicted DNA-binding transcriptional regulator AlpA
MPHKYFSKQSTESIVMNRKNTRTLVKPKPTTVTDDMKLLLTARDAAIVCGISQRTWRTWDMLGYTPQPVHVGRAIFWRYKELEQWIEAGCPRREIWHYREKK